MKHERISQDPEVKFGKPCIKGTRITVELILRLIGNGWSDATLLAEYPTLSAEDIRAAHAFAADYLANWAAVEAA
jgi:uncharacterized protein (DUF433 family)